MDILLMRLDAPLMSFGGPMVDNRGVSQSYPALSMITGLLSNALGYDHRDFERLGRLQDRIQYASREDRHGTELRDYQTADLSQPWMRDDHAWTTRGKVEKRKGGSAKTGTHIRYRDFAADAVHTVALALVPPDESPTLERIQAALREPCRPLFIGRKSCLPAAPIFLGRIVANGLKEALKLAELSDTADRGPRYRAWWPVDSTTTTAERGDIRARPVVDKRDWQNQIHVGERWIVHGTVEVHRTADE